MKQLGAELILERGKLFADGRLANSAFFRDRGEASFFHDSHEHLQRIESVHNRLPIPLRNGLYLPAQDALSLQQLARPPWSERRATRQRLVLSSKCIPSWNSLYSRACQVRPQHWHI